MSEIVKKEEVSNFFAEPIFKFSNAKKEDILNFEFNFLKDTDLIDYIEPGCGCTKAWVEDGKVKGTLTIANVGGLNPKGETAINKVVTVMLDPGERYFVPGPRKERKINDKKRWLKLSLVGTASVE